MSKKTVLLIYTGIGFYSSLFKNYLFTLIAIIHT